MPGERLELAGFFVHNFLLLFRVIVFLRGHEEQRAAAGLNDVVGLHLGQRALDARIAFQNGVASHDVVAEPGIPTGKILPGADVLAGQRRFFSQCTVFIIGNNARKSRLQIFRMPLPSLRSGNR